MDESFDFQVGDWIVYLPWFTSSRQWGIVIGLSPCNHSSHLYPIGYFHTEQIRFFSADFATKVNRRDVPYELAEKVALGAKELVIEKKSKFRVTNPRIERRLRKRRKKRFREEARAKQTIAEQKQRIIERMGY